MQHIPPIYQKFRTTASFNFTQPEEERGAGGVELIVLALYHNAADFLLPLIFSLNIFMPTPPPPANLKAPIFYSRNLRQNQIQNELDIYTGWDEIEKLPTLILYLEDVTTTDAVDLGSCVLDNHPHDIYVNWCDGSEIEHYEGTSKPTITHLYSKAGKQRIKIYGEFGWYGDSETSGLLRSYLVEIGVKNSSPLTKVSDFAFYCYNKLRTIDGKMFENCVEQTLFIRTFSYCTSLTTIPERLFDKNTKVTGFGQTFGGCYNLTTIPAGLLDKNTAVTHFMHTYEGCSKLQNICYNVACNPNTASPFSGLSSLNEIALWNVIPATKDLNEYIAEFPTVTAGTLYLGVSEGFESTARTELTEAQEEALTAKGWTFGGLLS